MLCPILFLSPFYKEDHGLGLSLVDENAASARNNKLGRSILCNSKLGRSILCNNKLGRSILCNSKLGRYILCNSKLCSSILCNSISIKK